MINDEECVARAIFSPRMIYNGELQTEAFQLRAAISENYISVLRMAFDTWRHDMMQIPQRRNRQLYGYASMGVRDIRDAGFLDVVYDVKACDNTSLASHAGIFITIGGESLIGGAKSKKCSG